MKIAIAQVPSANGDLGRAAERIKAYCSRAAEGGAGLCVFPANVIAPAVPVAMPDREGLLVDMAQLCSGLAGELACPAIVPVSLPGSDDPVLEAVQVGTDGVVPLRLLGALSQTSADDPGDEACGLSLPQVEVGDLTLGIAFTYEELEEYVDYDYHVDAVLFDLRLRHRRRRQRARRLDPGVAFPRRRRRHGRVDRGRRPRGPL